MKGRRYTQEYAAFCYAVFTHCSFWLRKHDIMRHIAYPQWRLTHANAIHRKWR